MPGEPAPLRNLPIEITVDGVTVSGVITALYRNDISVETRAPFTNLRTGVHVPHFAMYPVNRLATWDEGRTTAITERGQQRAEWLLRVLYDHALGKPTSWTVDERGPNGKWIRVESSR
jgi:hypothetical protein